MIFSHEKVVLGSDCGQKERLFGVKSLKNKKKIIYLFIELYID